MKLKIKISLLSESESESLTIPFYGDPLTPHVDCIQTAITVAAVTQNVCMSRHWKSKLVAYGSRKQPSPSLLTSGKLSLPGLQNPVAIKPCIRIDRMSNQWKAEFVNGNFCIQIFWGGHGDISSNP
jgi:hypothetical protein